MTSPDLTKLDALYEAATDGPWEILKRDIIRVTRDEAISCACTGRGEANAALIVALVNEYPSIRAEMEALREALSKIDPLTQYSDGNPNGQLFAVQQIVRELRTALNKEEGDND